MDWNLTVAVIGIVAAVAVGITVPVLIYRKQTPKRELQYQFEYESLVTARAEDAGITVMHGGVPVSNPYVVTLRAISKSRADIPSSAFDGGRSIEFAISTKVLAELGAHMEGQGLEFRLGHQSGGNGDAYIVLPAKIDKNSRARVRFLVDGQPSIICTNPLLDIDIRDTSLSSLAPAWKLRLAGTIAAGSTAAAVAVFVLGAISPDAAEGFAEMLVGSPILLAYVVAVGAAVIAIWWLPRR